MVTRIAKMWNRLSLRKRLMLPLGTMFLAALLVGAISLDLFTTTQPSE
jgi:two-component system, NarL family, sensor histidine kinase UhpB